MKSLTWTNAYLSLDNSYIHIRFTPGMRYKYGVFAWHYSIIIKAATPK